MGWIAEKETQRVDVMNTVEHDLQPLPLINPRPETPIGLAMNLDASVNGRSEPALVDQDARATDARVPAHLLVHCDLHLGSLGEFDAAHRFCVLIRERLLTQQMFSGSCALLDDGDLLCGVDRDVDDLHLR